ncbi:pyridoxamine 5'-phosphate oxidase family protein [Gordonia sp. HY285]|uniref:Pyridoxamine 5'-phosphate oxidase family protein n=1 Tax=Gordonia liuliyuniae TaxID=2911517 RepID=A0ABS9IXT6_9ACTN|nr:pyridoxamine 5'-phosphate oxidase family protein [Gordonia liuliyuniae]MCF8590321.1 pyridoxamine 5'-phosphate oxidase family protein [Gordonia liuliyuniae]MCF8611769.1 pyridoxamine 5'-phosphate oxidase family protein [Gordonia liuliyuniae]
MTTHNDSVTEMSEAQAWELLSGTVFGRLAVSVDNQPEIFPLNVHVDDRTILLRTAEGTKLSSLAVNERVCFETDAFTSRVGWSVIAKGSAHILTGTDEIAEADQAPLRPWIPTLKTIYVRITVDEISGRRFTIGPEPDRVIS